MNFKATHIALMLFIGSGTTVPLKYFERRGGLLNLSPNISPELDLSGNNECLGLGISVCDLINVDGKQNVNNEDDSVTNDDQADGEANAAGDGSYLINVAPELSPEIDASDNNGCTGVGVSACNPINVNGTQNEINK